MKHNLGVFVPLPAINRTRTYNAYFDDQVPDATIQHLRPLLLLSAYVYVSSLKVAIRESIFLLSALKPITLEELNHD